jgi:dCMP deaminase
VNRILEDLKKKGLLSTTTRRVDLKHLLSAERAARGSFYATRVGFVAIDRKGKRLARAHNGFPQGVRETLERWSRKEKDFYHLHAECAGIFNAVRHGYSTKGASAYVTHPPCPGCMRALVEAGFSKVVFGEQSLFERLDWQADMEHSFTLAREHHMAVMIYREKELGHAHADITRTEVDLKKVYDALLPQARGTAEENGNGGISLPAKPESPEWSAHPVIQALFGCARKGLALGAFGAIVDFYPECRAATALIQAGIRHVVVLNESGDRADWRWANEAEITKARSILTEDAGVVMEYVKDLNALPQMLTKAEAYLDATREGVKIPGTRLIRPR